MFASVSRRLDTSVKIVDGIFSEESVTADGQVDRARIGDRNGFLGSNETIAGRSMQNGREAEKS